MTERMLLDDLIAPAQMQYEEALLQNSDNETLWLEYYEAYSSEFAKSVFILERAVSELPASTLLWNAYLLLPWSETNRKTLTSLHERALQVLNKTPAFWFNYLDLLFNDEADSDRHRLRQALDMALFNLDRSHHGKIWEIYLKLVDEMSIMDSAAIYARLFEVLPEQVTDGPKILKEECVLKVVGYGDFTRAIKLFHELSSTQNLLSRLYAEFVCELLRLLLKGSAFHGDSFMEVTASNGAQDNPDFAKSYFLAVAAYYSARNNLEKTRHFNNRAFESSTSVHDVIEVFDIVSNWEENQMEKLYQNENLDELNLRMKQFKRLLDHQLVLKNDVLIKKSPNCIDHWLDRAKIYLAKDDERQFINTYVTAIRRINPLKAMTQNAHTMASLWMQYADIYISQGDLATANVIFSHAIKSQFKTVDELAQIYVAWTEMIFSVSDEDALKHIELVLYVPQGAEPPEPGKKQDKKLAHHLLYRSGSLWNFYIDMLKSMIEEGADNLAIYDKLSKVYSRLMALQNISLRMLLDYAEFMHQHAGARKSYAVLEAGIRCFKPPQAQYHMWDVYIRKAMQDGHDDDLVRDLFDRCLATEIPGFLAFYIYERYYTFEMERQNIVRSVKIMREALSYLTRSFSFPRYTKENRNKIADDKVLLYSKASHVIAHVLKDKQLYREIMSEALQDIQITLPSVIEFGLAFVEFETNEKEFHRVRVLFNHLAGLGHPDAHFMQGLWKKWQEWEVHHGTEESYRLLLTTHRQISNAQRDVLEMKADINPMGFVLGEIKTSPKEEPAKNPDVIELDMDM